MKNENLNNLESAMRFWDTKEAELKKIFRPDIDKERHFLQEKLRYFSHVRDKFNHNLSQGDKIFINVLNGEIKKLEHHLYPKRRHRVMARIGRRVEQLFENRKAARQADRQIVKSNDGSLTPRAKLENAVANKVAQQLNSGNDQKQAATGQEQKHQQSNEVPFTAPKEKMTNDNLRKGLDAGASNLTREGSLRPRLRHRLH